MTETQLNLIVIRSIDVEKSVEFYRLLGLNFIEHRHGSGLEHYASQLGQLTFEIYPHTAPVEASVMTRLGFQVLDLEATIIQLQQEDIAIVQQPTASEWGLRAIVADPDGNKIELTQVE